MPLSLAEFVSRWKVSSLKESAASQSHFIDLCDILGEPHPAAADSVGDRYTFQKYVTKLRSQDKGFADVWLRDHFAWEYKGDKKNLHKAYVQLTDYREDLGNPPLLVVCDLNRFEVHTNFTATTKRVYSFDLDDLGKNVVTATCPLPPLEVLRALFSDYNILRPERTAARVTEDAAKKFLRLAERLELEPRADKPSKEQIAHFLMRIMFCLFADSIGLLPEHVFRDLIGRSRTFPRKFRKQLADLFGAMAEPIEGFFGPHSISWFNGGLFNDSSTIELNEGDMGILIEAAKLGWEHIEPAIFGTLFERSLDAGKRSLIGAHYTSSADILLLIEPVLMQPLERRWATVKQQAEEALALEAAQDAKLDPRQARLRPSRQSEQLLSDWVRELTAVRVLDPACGSGNFLYLALRRMLDLWNEARKFAYANGISLVIPDIVSPRQLYGIETDFYAHQLSSIVVWIGFLQWKHEHGIVDEKRPILENLTTIEKGDAILRYDTEGKPYEPEWPQADYIVGNPPFLGSRKLRVEAGSGYIDSLFDIYKDRVSQEADLVTYWFEKARAAIEAGRTDRAGLIATQAVRQGGSRQTLQRILQTTDIFLAWANREWVLNGAAVRIALVGFGRAADEPKYLDGELVTSIHPDLTTGLDLTRAVALAENRGLAFQGPVKVGKFELNSVQAEKMLRMPTNPNNKSNADVIKPWIIAKDITGRPRHMSIIDFGTKLSHAEAALYEAPYEYVRTHVYPGRQKNNRPRRKEFWWRHGEANLGMRRALSGLRRYIASPRVSTHRLFNWQLVNTLADSRVVGIASDQDWLFGTLHSVVHEAWSIATSSRHGVGNDITYNIESCFDTFPFPWPPGKEPKDDPRVQTIADAAKHLVDLRDRWLNPPDTPEADLKKRTLTNLYNARPQWLADAHQTLDHAVFAAYNWPHTLTTQQILENLLTLNHQRAAGQAAPPAASRKTSVSLDT